MHAITNTGKHYETCQSFGPLMLSVMAVTRGCWRAASSPVSGADSQIIFWSCLNEGWEEPPARPRITDSLVVRKAPDCFILSKAYILWNGFHISGLKSFEFNQSIHIFLSLQFITKIRYNNKPKIWHMCIQYV